MTRLLSIVWEKKHTQKKTHNNQTMYNEMRALWCDVLSTYIYRSARLEVERNICLCRLAVCVGVDVWCVSRWSFIYVLYIVFATAASHRFVSQSERHARVVYIAREWCCAIDAISFWGLSGLVVWFQGHPAHQLKSSIIKSAPAGFRYRKKQFAF